MRQTEKEREREGGREGGRERERERGGGGRERERTRKCVYFIMATSYSDPVAKRYQIHRRTWLKVQGLGSAHSNKG